MNPTIVEPSAGRTIRNRLLAISSRKQSVSPCQVFLIYPNRVDRDILGVVTKALSACAHATSWQQFPVGDSIPDHIHARLRDSDVIVAILHDNDYEWNPNVFYEVGYASGCSNRVISVIHDSQVSRLPFDLRHRKSLVYRNPNAEREALEAAICTAVAGQGSRTVGSEIRVAETELQRCFGTFKRGSSVREQARQRCDTINARFREEAKFTSAQQAQPALLRRTAGLLFRMQSVGRIRYDALLHLACMVGATLAALAAIALVALGAIRLGVPQPAGWPSLMTSPFWLGTIFSVLVIAIATFGWRHSGKPPGGWLVLALVTVILSAIAVCLFGRFAKGEWPDPIHVALGALITILLVYILVRHTREASISYVNALWSSLLAGLWAAVLMCVGVIMVRAIPVLSGGLPHLDGLREAVTGISGREYLLRAAIGFAYVSATVFFLRAPWILSSLPWLLTLQRPRPVAGGRLL